jgi:hypothetical protein
MMTIEKDSTQTLLRNGVCVATAASRRAFAATAVYSRIFSALREDLRGIAERESNS